MHAILIIPCIVEEVFFFSYRQYHFKDHVGFDKTKTDIMSHGLIYGGRINYIIYMW
jgi:hypothetical protein